MEICKEIQYTAYRSIKNAVSHHQIFRTVRINCNFFVQFKASSFSSYYFHSYLKPLLESDGYYKYSIHKSKTIEKI